MPIMNGLELIKNIKYNKDNDKIKIVVMTADEILEEKKMFNDLSVD